MDENEKNNAYAFAARRLAQIQQGKAQKKEQEEAQNKKNSESALLFTGTSLESVRAKYIAQALFPVLAEVIPESVKTAELKKNFLARVFKGPEEYIRRTAMIEMYRDLQSFNRRQLEDKFKFTREEIKKIFASGNDDKRHKLMKTIAAITGYSG